MFVRLQASAGCCNRKQYGGAVDHVTLPPQRRNKRELEHDDTGYDSLPRSTPVDARPAAATVENETLGGNLSARAPTTLTRRQSADDFTRVAHGNDVGNSRIFLSRPAYR